MRSCAVAALLIIVLLFVAFNVGYEIGHMLVRALMP